MNRIQVLSSERSALGKVTKSISKSVSKSISRSQTDLLTNLLAELLTELLTELLSELQSSNYGALNRKLSVGNFELLADCPTY